MISNGWFYNVSELKAVELQFNNRESIIRIGTNKPDEVSQLIQSLIAAGEVLNNETGNSTKKWMRRLNSSVKSGQTVF